MHPLEIVVYVAAGVVLLPCVVVLVEVVVGVFARGSSATGERGAACVVVPAHNEAGIIRATAAHLAAAVRDSDEVLVVADNCTDGTAAEARAAGVRVVERQNKEMRGKGYALAHGVAHAGEAAVIVVVDADCRVGEGTIDDVAHVAARTGRPAQAIYEMELPASARVGDRVSAFAFAVKNALRARGLHALAGVCHLTGSGMAFPRELVEGDVLASGDIVEDMRLGVDLALRGSAPVLAPGGRVTSTLPGTSDAQRVQRTRWEHGHLAVLVSCAPRLVWRGITRGRLGLVALGLDLAVPPLSLLVLGAVGLGALGGAAAWWAGSWIPAIAGLLPIGVLAFAVGVAWAHTGRRFLPAWALPGVVVYAVAKVPMYVRALVSREKAWVRTPRES